MIFYRCDNCEALVWEDEPTVRTVSGDKWFCPRCKTGWLFAAGMGVKPTSEKASEGVE